MAYVENPNAAAVGRALKTNERHVRRLVSQFEDWVDERHREQGEERRQRSHAREARVQEWADETLGESLRQLDALAASANEGVALRSLKIKFDLALRVTPATSTILHTEIAQALEVRERDVARRISEIEFGIAEGEVDRG